MGQQYFVRIVELPGRVHDCLWRFGRSAGRHPTRHLSAQAVAKTVPSCRAQSRDTGITWVGTTLLHRGKLVPRRHGRTKQCFGVPLGGIRKGAPLRSPVRACGGLPPSEYSDPGKPSTQVMSRCQAADRATGPLVGRERRPPFPKKQTCMSPHPSRNQEILASESTNPSARTGIRRGTWELSLAEGCSEGLEGRAQMIDRNRLSPLVRTLEASSLMDCRCARKRAGWGSGRSGFAYPFPGSVISTSSRNPDSTGRRQGREGDSGAVLASTRVVSGCVNEYSAHASELADAATGSGSGLAATQVRTRTKDRHRRPPPTSQSVRILPGVSYCAGAIMA